MDEYHISIRVLMVELFEEWVWGRLRLSWMDDIMACRWSWAVMDDGGDCTTMLER